MVWGAKGGIFVALTIALCVYGPDCTPTPEPSMACCNTMRVRSPHNHCNHRSQDCCKTVLQMYAALGQPAAPLRTSFSPVMLGVVPPSGDPLSEYAAGRIVGNHSHDPPKFRVSAMALNLRI